MSAEPSRRLQGGNALVHMDLGQFAAVLGTRSNRTQRKLVPAIGGAAACVVLGALALAGLPGRANTLTRASLPPAAPVPVAAPAPTPTATEAAGPDVTRFGGKVGEDLTRSLIAAGVPERQGREYVALLGRAIRLTDGLSVDDRFDLVIERNSDGSLGQLLFAGLDRIARADVELMKWTDGREVIWVNADGVGGGSDSESVHLPVPGQVTSAFGQRFHPILGHARFHKGVDLRATFGSPITAAASGRVVAAGWRGGYGRQVVIAHGGGIQTTYSHMSRIAAQPGAMVNKGQLIGYVGSSGLSTGPHVHFEVMKNGQPINPMSVKLPGGPAQLEGAKLHAFQDTLRAVLTGHSGS